jgi:hypothetical protein
MSSITRLRSLFDRDKGASYGNEYEVTMNFDSTKNAQLLNNLRIYGFESFGASSAFDNMMFLCDEASLPGTFAATQEIDGLFAGRLIQYPHGKLYNDFRLSFIMTNEHNPQKFFEAWFYSIFPERSINGQGEIISNDVNNRLNFSNATTIRFYEEIVCPQITVTKSFKDRSSYKGGQSCKYDIVNAYPYTIESVPLGYGASTLNKLKVSFRYEKHVATFY